ncbi:MAG: cell wall metabolism sensor histidine kinase WalK [Clostridiales bacterium]|nr:cell wall metabolism sensor histidine kinase WalK [Clostridiales bacterium]
MSVGVLLCAGIEGTLYVLCNYKFLISPVKRINATAKKLSNGEYDARTCIRTADGEVKKLGKTIDGIADEFENLEQMRKSFVANASHELRSPLTSMQGFLQAMSDGTISPEDTDKYLKIVLNETKRLNSLITSMLDLSRMESGKYPLTMSRFEINAVIRQIVERFEPNLVKKELQLDVDFARPTSYVYADKDKIIQVLINLIDNAVKYSPAYSRILVTTHIHGEKIYIAVKDQGLGISKKDQLLIFDKFYMGDKARTPHKSKGTGLGLSIVKRILEDHKEAIRVESNKGAGATFLFTLTLFDPAKHKIESGTIL